MKTTDYDRRYLEQDYYWGNEISKMAISILDLFPAKDSRPRVLEIGCGEGTNAAFLAKNGYEVTAFDLSRAAIEKTNALAAQTEVQIKTFLADINDYVPSENFDIVFSSGTLQYLLPEKRKQFINAIKSATCQGGIHVLHTFAHKAYISTAPDAEDSENLWPSGKLLSFYQDWRIERFIEEIKSCTSSGVPHEHSHNRIWAKKI
jgi:tellurite methyltransferase